MTRRQKLEQMANWKRDKLNSPCFGWQCRDCPLHKPGEGCKAREEEPEDWADHGGGPSRAIVKTADAILGEEKLLDELRG